jgi:3-deoxy-D-manno-octulosonic-acid transferase
MAYFLNLAYLLLLVAAAPWLLYQRLRHGKYREGWEAKFYGRVPERTGNARCIWLHAVSVGEVNLLEPILGRWERLHPDWEIVISTTTQAGYHLACKRYAPRLVCYCPLDFTWAVRRAMRRLRPDLLVLAELELWPNLIAAARESGAKVAVINGRLSEKSFRGYQRIGWLAKRTLENIDLVAAQNEEYASRFRALGAPAVQITGSIKFDGARTDRQNPETRRLAALAGIAEDDTVFLAGSTQAPEEQFALEVFQRLAKDHPRLRLILVPRHPERFDEVAELLDRRGVSWQRRSALESGPLAPRVDIPGSNQDRPSDANRPLAERVAHNEPAHILLVDVVGELGYWWGTAQIAFVGGSLTSRGGQNMIEPAAYGAAVAFGPNTWNFRDVVALLLAREAAIVVRNQDELESFVRRCLADAEFAASLGREAQQLVIEQQGAADRTVQLLNGLVDGIVAAKTDDGRRLRTDVQAADLARQTRSRDSMRSTQY